MQNKDLWQPNRLIEDRYNRSIQSLVDYFVKTYLRPDLPMDSPFDIIDKLRQYVTTEAFKTYALAAAARMVTGFAVQNAKTWRQAASKSMRGRFIYEALQSEIQGPVGLTMYELIRNNAEMISTFPLDIASEVNNYISDQWQSGVRAEQITEELRTKFPKITRARIQLVTRTESSKASTALTEARAESLDLLWYIWRTSEDARVRSSHRHMEGILISWKEPASPEKLIGMKSAGNYAPGNIYNCRCYPESLIYLDQVSWPHKVYHNGAIHKMTRSAFEKINSGYISTYRKAA